MTSTGCWRRVFPAETGYFHLAILAMYPARERRHPDRAQLDGADQRLGPARPSAYLEASGAGYAEHPPRRGYADHGGPVTFPGGPIMYPLMARASGQASLASALSGRPGRPFEAES